MEDGMFKDGDFTEEELSRYTGGITPADLADIELDDPAVRAAFDLDCAMGQDDKDNTS